MKIVPDMTCNVFGGTLSITQLQLLDNFLYIVLIMNECCIQQQWSFPLYFNMCAHCRLLGKNKK